MTPTPVVALNWRRRPGGGARTGGGLEAIEGLALEQRHLYHAVSDAWSASASLREHAAYDAALPSLTEAFERASARGWCALEAS
ncbi:MAG: hypothetical protein U0838_17000 [Chloroflexota bacterium]